MATLYVLATPIGNLEDLSPRARRVLEQCPVVAAESVRRTRALLSHLGLGGKRIVSCREANRRRAAGQVLAELEAGRDVALVSDAGTPGICDPGSWVVEQVAGSGHRISPVPGPSALTAAWSVSGLGGGPLLFLGFLPAKAGPRRRLLEQARDTGWTLAMFEAPHRLAETARDLAELMGERAVVMTRELTKLNQEVVHTTCRELASRLEPEVRGEVTLMVAGSREQARRATRSQPQELDRLLTQGLEQAQESPSRLARRVAAATGHPREQVYRRLLELQEDGGYREGMRDKDHEPS